MITIEELATKQAAHRLAVNHWLELCQMHEQRMATMVQVNAARNRANELETAYNNAVWLYQQQAQATERR